MSAINIISVLAPLFSTNNEPFPAALAEAVSSSRSPFKTSLWFS